MKLGECSTIRTGLVFSRKAASLDEEHFPYPALSLKNITEDGGILLSDVEDYLSNERLKKEYFTRVGDVLLRLSAPYTSVLIEINEAGLLIPSHFAVIRVSEKINPRYLQWWLTKNRKNFYQIASGGTMMGTISSGYIAEMEFAPPSIGEQAKIGDLLELAHREQQLLALLLDRKKKLVDAAISSYKNSKGDSDYDNKR